MSTGAVLPASIAFIAIPQLKRLEPETAVQALLSLHDVLRRFRTGLLQPPARILSTLTGALLVLPDATDRYLHASLDEIAKDCHARGLAIRVGVTHGDVQELSDVDGTANYIGTPINIAARLATSPENLGCAFHKDFVSHVQAAFIPGARLRPWQYPRVVIKGKPHDAATGFPCTQAPGEAFPVLDAVVAEQLPAITDGVQNINATVLAYDLPHFSAGDANQLSRRFRAVIGAMQQSQVARASSRAFFSPGGDGGIVALQLDEQFGRDQAHEIALRLFDRLAAESEGWEPAIRVESCIGLHYGPVQLYRNAEQILRPTGRTCFVADEIAGDEHARRHGGVVVTSAFKGIISSGSDRRLEERFERLPEIGDELSPAHGIERYVHRTGPYVRRSEAVSSAPAASKDPPGAAASKGPPASPAPPAQLVQPGKGPLFVMIAAHDGADAVRDLEVHLALAVRRGVLQLWHEQKIPEGGLVEEIMGAHIQQAAVVLLMVTPRLFSGHTYNLIEQAMARIQHGTRVIPIMVDAVNLEDTPFKGLAALPRDAVENEKVVRPINSRRKPDQEKAWADIAGALSGIARMPPRGKST